MMVRWSLIFETLKIYLETSILSLWLGPLNAQVNFWVSSFTVITIKRQIEWFIITNWFGLMFHSVCQIKSRIIWSHLRKRSIHWNQINTPMTLGKIHFWSSCYKNGLFSGKIVFVVEMWLNLWSGSFSAALSLAFWINPGAPLPAIRFNYWSNIYLAKTTAWVIHLPICDDGIPGDDGGGGGKPWLNDEDSPSISQIFWAITDWTSLSVL